MKRMLSAAGLAALLVFMLQQSAQASVLPGLASSDWPMFQHDVRHSGMSNYLGISTYPVQVWQTYLPPLGGGESGMGMSEAPDGTIYADSWGTLFAVDLSHHVIKWKYLDGGGSRGVPAITDNGNLVWGFGDSVATIKPNGSTVWGWADLDGNFAFGSSPAIDTDGNIYVSHDGVWSFTSAGNLRWTYPSSFYSHSSPAIGPDGSIYASVEEGLVSLKPDGSQNWLLGLHTNDDTPTVAQDGTIYIGFNDNLYTASGKISAITPGGAISWTFTLNPYMTTMNIPPALGPDGTLYFADATQLSLPNFTTLYAVRPNGSLKWQWRFYSRAWSQPVVDKAGRVFFCEEYPSCVGIDASGNTLWTITFPPDQLGLVGVMTAPFIVSDGTMLTWIRMAHCMNMQSQPV